MEFSISREVLLKPLQLVAGVVERKQTMPIMANVLIVINNGVLSLTGTDGSIEMIGSVRLEGSVDDMDITVPARKLLDVCKSLPDHVDIKFSLKNQKLIVKSGKTKFTLSTLPSTGFPCVEETPESLSFTLKQSQLKRLIDRTGFAMAQQDVRTYLNGMLWILNESQFIAVATDGHRLAKCEIELSDQPLGTGKVIVPRKGVLELSKLLTDEDDNIEIKIGTNHIRASTDNFTFISKLIDGKFPDYNRVIPKNGTKVIYGERTELRQAFSRTAILSNEKYRGVRLLLEDGAIQIVANNPEQEEAEEVVAVDYQGESLEIGFNVSYLVDALTALSEDNTKITLADSNSSAVIEEAEGGDSIYVVMPMRL